MQTQAVVGPLEKRVVKLMGISTTSLRCLSSGEFVSDAQTVFPSCSQMPCSDTLTQSGVGVNSTCGGACIGDTCMVFCTEGYQAVSDETSTLTCTCDKYFRLSFGGGFSDCLFAGRLRECVQQEASVSQSVVSLLNLDGRSGGEVESEMPTGTHPDPDGNIIQRHQVEPKRPSSSDTKGSKMLAMFNM